MDQPRRFRVHEENGVTNIEWRWVGARHALALVFLPMICGMWFFWYTDSAKDGLWSTFEVWFLAITASLPLASIYGVLAKVCNRSRLVIDADNIELRQGPFPWPGNGRWSRSGLSRFVCIGSSSSSMGIVTRWYTVYALWSEPRKRRIAGDLRDKDEALWLATTLDRRFGNESPVEAA